jgi:hypothetical protein
MLSATTKWRLQAWSPFGFCVFISLFSAVIYFAEGRWWLGFVLFLPICFILVGSAVHQMQDEILELRKQVAGLQANKGA